MVAVQSGLGSIKTAQNGSKMLAQATDTCLTKMGCEKPYSLWVDASNLAVDAVLTQNDSQALEKPIAFAFVKLSLTQRNWATVEKDMRMPPPSGHYRSFTDGCYGVRRLCFLIIIR